ncbi:MAG: glycoside hydrolase family 37 [Bacteroidetes bacterium]|jgi:putative isomerase|nr:glycoside hydrolase family 37 [Bacteroidota bacterium]
MKINILILLMLLFTSHQLKSQFSEKHKQYIEIIKEHVYEDYKGMYREPAGALIHPFIVPGSEQYSNILWDWDSWLTNVALRQILEDTGNEKDKQEALRYEQGCVMNFLDFGGGKDGWIPFYIHESDNKEERRPDNIYESNMHKPCLAQHAAFITKMKGGDAEWIRDRFYYLQQFVNNYLGHHKHRPSGLFFWQDDVAIGVDNDPTTFYRPPESSGSIYLNSLMYKELKATAYLAKQLNLGEISKAYERDAEILKQAIRDNCWDEWLGFYYSVDFNLLPYQKEEHWAIHSGFPRTYNNLIMRIGVWSGFLSMWAEIATPEQAERMVKEHFHDTSTFNAPYGIRTLSKQEKMYNVRASRNPSLWTGPIWGVSNYMVFSGLLNYGYEKEARELALETITLFGRDLERFGALHEYYLPENGEPVLNKGFQNWNYLVMNMIAWLENRKQITEF